METRKSVLKLFKMAKLHYQKLKKGFSKITKENTSESKLSNTSYCHRIYINPSDYYLSTPVTSILKPLDSNYDTEEITKIQNFINSLSLKSGIQTNLQEEKIDFDHIQNYISTPN